MKVEIQYAADYRYDERVSFSPHLLRLMPKVDRFTKVRNFDFRTNRNAVIHWRRDVFDNEVASVFYPDPALTLRIRLRAKLEIEPKNAFGFLLEPRAFELPFDYSPDEKRVLAPYLGDAPVPRLNFWQPPQKGNPTIDSLVSLNEALHHNIRYERRAEGDARPAHETIELGFGSCRDFAVVMVDAIRGMGLAARYASGYLCEFDAVEKKAEGALHAWVEIYLPGAGWIGLDPTNGTLCDHHHLTAAVGRSPADVSPVSGSYFHTHRVPHRLQATLKILSHGSH